MKVAPLPKNEKDRLAALMRYGMVDTPSNAVLDGITQTLADLCEAPIALISLIDPTRQWFKSCIGVPIRETERDIAFCTHAILDPNEIMEVEDATKDARFYDNPLVMGEPYIRFYAGKPLVTADGFALGTLCVIDHKARRLSEPQRTALARLAEVVINLMEEHRQSPLAGIERAVAQAVSHGLVLTDLHQPDNPIIYCNRAFEELTGYPRDDILGKNCRFLQGRDTDPATIKTMRTALEGQRDCQVTIKNYRKDGTSFWNELMVSPVRNEAGKLTHFMGIQNDVTDRYILEQALRENEAKLRLLTDALPACVSYVDHNLRFRFNNRTYEAWFGKSREELFGKSIREVLGEEGYTNAKPYIDVAFSGESIMFEETLPMPDGPPRELETSLIPHHGDDDSVSGMCVLAVDITERKRAAAALHESRAFLEATLDGLPVNLSILDETGTIVATNAAWRRFTARNGYTESDGGLGRSYLEVSEAIAIELSDQAKVAAANLREVLSGGRSYLDVEFPCRTALGTRWFSFRVTTFASAGSKRIIVAHEDITQRKQIEEESRQREVELAHVARLSTMGEMATGIAHELNQPLVAITNYCEAARDCLGEGGEALDDVPELLEKTAAQAQRAGDIIRRIRAFVRKDTGHKVAIDVNDMVRESVALVESDAREKGVTLKLQLEPLPRLRLDEVQIGQVLLNLLRNGIEAMEQAGITHRELRIITGQQGDGKARVTVEDTGPGFEEGAMDDCFTAFVSSKPDGMGLGLPISFSIVEAHGGRLWAEAGSEAGARFHFTLPMTENAESA